jgi:subtilisin family serine protease
MRILIAFLMLLGLVGQAVAGATSCPNFPGKNGKPSWAVYDKVTKDEAGNCTCPAGTEWDPQLGLDGACVAPDYCSNWEGWQGGIPDGGARHADGTCSCVNGAAYRTTAAGVPYCEKPQDYCSNFEGQQPYVPEHTTRREDGTCACEFGYKPATFAGYTQCQEDLDRHGIRACPAGQIYNGRGCVTPDEANPRTTAEILRNAGIAQVRAWAAWEQGWTGKGVRVGVIDTGVTSQADLPRVVAGGNFVGGSSSADDNGHGTHVAGIIAAARDGQGVVGVAPDAAIVAYKVLDSAGAGSSTSLVAAVRAATAAGVPIVNLSLAFGGLVAPQIDFSSGQPKTVINWRAEFGQAFDAAVAAGTTFVIAAGNDGMPCSPTKMGALGTIAWCGLPAALPVLPEFRSLLNGPGAWIAVGAIGAHLDPYTKRPVLAGFSNAAGITQDWYIVAPGENIVSTGRDGSPTRMSGTSMATPFVAGALALLKQKHPFLTGKQLAQIIFTTAVDLGDPGVDAVYGHGLLDIEAAMRPAGGLGIPTKANPAGAPLRASAVPAILVPALARSATLKSTLLVDGFGRGYPVDASRLAVAVPTQFAWEAFRFTDPGAGALRLGLAPAADGGAPQVALGLQLGGGLTLLASRQEGVFGARSTGLLETQAGASGTWQTRLAMERQDWRAWLDLGFAPDSRGSGLVASTTGLVAAGAGVATSWQLGERSTLSASLASPLALVAGRARLRVPTSQADDGGLGWSDEDLALRQPWRSRQVDFRLGLDHPIGRSGSLALGLTASAKPAAGVASVRADARLQLAW